MTPDESKAISALTGDPAKPFRVVPQTEGTVARSARVLSGVPGPSPGTGKVATSGDGNIQGAIINRQGFPVNSCRYCLHHHGTRRVARY